MERILILLFITSLLGLSSCYYDNEEELYGLACDTTAVSYARTDIWPMIETATARRAATVRAEVPIGHIFTDHASVDGQGDQRLYARPRGGAAATCPQMP
jgi:hypothetical protein